MAKSIYELYLKHVESRPNAPALRYKQGGSWKDMSWKDLHANALKITAALMAEGVQHKDRVNVLSNTRMEWMCADLGIMGAGATCVAIYQSNMADECEFIIQNCGARILFAEDESQLEKVRKVKAAIPEVKRVILIDGQPKPEDGEWVTTLADFYKKGEAYLAANAADVSARASKLAPDDLVCLIYTSGTTGRPKGVMLTHDNFIYETEALEKTNLLTPDDVQLLFLPMAHVFAKVLQVGWLKIGFVMALAESIDKLVPNMAEVRPTVMCAVPRIYERVYSKVVGGGLEAGGVKARLFQMAISESQHAGNSEDEGRPYGGIKWSIAQALVFKKINQRLNDLFGGRLRFFVSGGAPLSRKIAYFFKHAGVKICEGYGLTETSAATTINLPGNIKIGTVGQPLPGTEIKIAGDGEILIRGRGVMKGYWANEAATKDVLDPDGWFHSGDIGVVDKDGFVRITDRKKDIIVTAGGKNVAPQNLENSLKTNPYVSQVMIYGDKRKYLSALLTLNEETWRKWATDNGIHVGSIAELAKNQKVQAQMQTVVDEFNKTIPSYETIKKFAILEKDFTVGDELTPTLKVKRKFTSEKYKSILDSFYGDDKFD